VIPLKTDSASFAPFGDGEANLRIDSGRDHDPFWMEEVN
jgi:hypothetical protein